MSEISIRRFDWNTCLRILRTPVVLAGIAVLGLAAALIAVVCIRQSAVSAMPRAISLVVPSAQLEPIVNELPADFRPEPILKPAQYMKTRLLGYHYEEPEPEPVIAYGYNGVGTWVCIPNSYVNHPVAQGADNSFYLTHNYYGGYDSNGCIYAHCNNNLSSLSALSRNTVLFGHNKSLNRYYGNLSNLGSILQFQDYNVAASHRYITLSVNGETAYFLVFAALDTEVANEKSFYYWQTNAGGGSWSTILNQAMDRSYWDYGIDVNAEDKILTLSTCSYDWGYDANYNTYAKFVVMARMLRPGESINGLPAISANADRRTPAGLSRWAS